MVVVFLGVGGVGRHADGAGGHDGVIGDQPLRPVFRNYADAVAGFDAEAGEARGQAQNLVRGLRPGDGAPGLIDTAAAPMEERFVAPPFGLGEQQIGEHRRLGGIDGVYAWFGHVGPRSHGCHSLISFIMRESALAAKPPL